MTSAEHGAPSTNVSSLCQHWEQTPRDLYITKSFRNLSVSGRSLACRSGSTDVMNSLSLHNSHLKVSKPCESRASAHPVSNVLQQHTTYTWRMHKPRASTSCAVRVHCVELHLTFWRLEFRTGSYILKTICVPRLYKKKRCKNWKCMLFWAKRSNRWLISNTQIVSITDNKDSAYK